MSSLRLAMSIDSENPNVGDIYLHNGKCRLTASLSEEVQQLLFTRFRMFQGEWFLNRAAGTPWFQQILGIKQSQDVVSAILKSVVTTCPGVARVTSWQLRPVGRAISPLFACTLTDGTTLRSSDFAPFIVPLP